MKCQERKKQVHLDEKFEDTDDEDILVEKVDYLIAEMRDLRKWLRENIRSQIVPLQSSSTSSTLISATQSVPQSIINSGETQSTIPITQEPDRSLSGMMNIPESIADISASEVKSKSPTILQQAQEPISQPRSSSYQRPMLVGRPICPKLSSDLTQDIKTSITTLQDTKTILSATTAQLEKCGELMENKSTTI